MISDFTFTIILMSRCVYPDKQLRINWLAVLLTRRKSGILIASACASAGQML
jgi:hypothetical protein